MSKESFREALLDWTDFVARSGSANSFRYTERHAWIKDAASSNASFHGAVVIEPVWSEEHIRVLQEGAEWVRAVQEADSWSQLADHVAHNFGCTIQPGTLYNALPMLLRNFRPPLTYDEVTRSSRVVSTATWFTGAFEAFSRFIESPSMRFRFTTVVAGLSIADDALPIELSGGVFLELMPSELTNLFGSLGIIRPHMFGGRPGPYENPHQPWISLRWTRSFPKITRDSDYDSKASHEEDKEYAENIRESFVSALALTKFGSAFLSATARTEVDCEIGSINFGIQNKYPDMNVVKNAMTLGKRDLAVLQKLYALLSSRGRNDKIRLAARRLAFAMDNEREEDRLLDGMIACEAVLGTGSEIRYHVSLRCAHLLEPADKHGRRRVFDDMQHAYSVRSRIVHGSIPAEKDLVINQQRVTLPEFVIKIEDHIRDAVRTLAELGDIPDWDDLIVGEARR